MANAIFWIYLGGTAWKIFLGGIKLFCFQDRKLKLSVSVWNWIYWNLTKFQLILLIQTIVIIIFSIFSDWVDTLWGFKKFFFKLILKVSAFYLEKQKSFISKKNIFQVVVNIKTKKLCLPTQFSGRVLVNSHISWFVSWF